jgi:TonB family protein
VVALAACAGQRSAPPRAGVVATGPITPPALPPPCAGPSVGPEGEAGETALEPARAFLRTFGSSVGARWLGDAAMSSERLGAAYGYRDRDVEVCVRVDAAGRLTRAEVRTSSGLPFLDDEALRALRRAQPFPPPPAGLAAEGGLSFGYRFRTEVDPPAAACAPPGAAPARAFGGTALVALCDRVYVDPAAPPERVAGLREAEARAARRVADLLGPLRVHPPLTIYCDSDPCRVYFSGPARRSCIIKPGETAPSGRFASAGEPTVVIARTDARAVNDLAHDLAHLELRARVGDAFIPQWFNDGLATLAADEPACVGVEGLVVEDLRGLDGRDTWGEMQDHVSPGTRAAVYCEARRAVVAWLDAHGGATALRALVEDVAAGRPFYDAYEHPGGGRRH